MFCHKCGSRLIEGSVFCRECSAAVPTGSTESRPTVAARRRRQLPIVALAISGAIAIAIIIAVVVSVRRGSGGAQGEPRSDPKTAAGKLALAGYGSACAVTDSAGVRCWGRNIYGLLGVSTDHELHSSVPLDVVGLSRDVVSVSAGETHVCAVTKAGGVKCWGNNHDGELGDGTKIQRDAPVDVIGLSGVTVVANGGYHTCALTVSGSVKCWGFNEHGELGDRTFTSRSMPVDAVGLSSGVVAISAGENHTCAVTVLGGAKCWGANYGGQLGTKSGLGDCGQSYGCSSRPLDVDGLTSGVTAISAAYDHTCALTSVGGVKCWGRTGGYQLGNGLESGSDTCNNNTPCTLTPTDVSGLTTGIVAISSSGSHTCALTTEGGVKCWGHWRGGSVAQVPVDVPGLIGVAAISAGGSDTCVLMKSRRVKCWGGSYEAVVTNGTPYTVQLANFVPVDISAFP